MNSKINIKTFSAQNSLNICPIVYTNKNYICQKGWKELNWVLSQNLSVPNHGGYMINLNGIHKKFIVIDTDNEETYNYTIDLINKYNLKQVDTPSYSGLTNNLFYKRHFWFELPKLDFEIQDNKGIFMEKLDIIISHIAESKNTEIEADLDILPLEIINLFYNNQHEQEPEPELLENSDFEVSETKIIELLNILNH